MTTKQKAEAYDRVREKIAHRFGSRVVEEVFSEFEKSKDERIRSIIRGWIYTRPPSFFDNGISKEDILAWLENQGDKDSQVKLPTFTFDDILALQCGMETVKKVQEDKGLYEALSILHNKVHDAYHLEKQSKQEEPQVYKTEDGEVITYSETKGYKVVSTTLEKE